MRSFLLPLAVLSLVMMVGCASVVIPKSAPPALSAPLKRELPKVRGIVTNRLYNLEVKIPVMTPSSNLPSVSLHLGGAGLTGYRPQQFGAGLNFGFRF